MSRNKSTNEITFRKSWLRTLPYICFDLAYILIKKYKCSALEIKIKTSILFKFFLIIFTFPLICNLKLQDIKTAMLFRNEYSSFFHWSDPMIILCKNIIVLINEFTTSQIILLSQTFFHIAPASTSIMFISLRAIILQIASQYIVINS